MTETTTTFVCQRCDAPFERAYRVGRKPQACDPCKLEIKRAAGRAYIAKTYVKRVPGVPETFTCTDCRNPFEFTRGSGTQSTRCRPCQKRRNAETTARGKQGKTRTDLKFAPGERVYPCEICGASIQHAATGRKRLTCDQCAAAKKVAAAAELRLTAKPSISCIDCEAEIPVGWHGPGGRKRCDGCARKKARAIQKRMNNERRAWKNGADSEEFEDAEIFERDGWRCGLCHRKIDKRLRHPHMMSAQVDHIIPFTKGGHHVRTNVQASHRLCNQKKYNLGGGEQLMLIG